MSVGANVKRIRRDKGLTQGELAEKSKLGLNLISRLERDATDPRLSSLYKLMTALDCSADDLVNDESKSNLKGNLSRQFKRASSLPEDEQKILLKLIDRYCNSVVYELMLGDGVLHD